MFHGADLSLTWSMCSFNFWNHFLLNVIKVFFSVFYLFPVFQCLLICLFFLGSVVKTNTLSSPKLCTHRACNAHSRTQGASSSSSFSVGRRLVRNVEKVKVLRFGHKMEVVLFIAGILAMAAMDNLILGEFIWKTNRRCQACLGSPDKPATLWVWLVSLRQNRIRVPGWPNFNSV